MCQATPSQRHPFQKSKAGQKQDKGREPREWLNFRKHIDSVLRLILFQLPPGLSQLARVAFSVRTVCTAAKLRAMSAHKVPRRTLGATGLQVSVLGFGASPLGGVFHVRMPLQTGTAGPVSQGCRPLRAALTLFAT